MKVSLRFPIIFAEQKSSVSRVQTHDMRHNYQLLDHRITIRGVSVIIFVFAFVVGVSTFAVVVAVVHVVAPVVVIVVVVVVVSKAFSNSIIQF